ncbi:MAG: outer membrane beta-barrel protein [Bacteroidota bacterium]
MMIGQISKGKIGSYLKMAFVFVSLSVINVNTLSSQGLYLGGKGGGQAISSYIEHSIFNLSMRTTIIPGGHGGFFMKYLPEQRDNVIINSGVQLGVNYVQKGWGQEFLSAQPDYQMRLNYLEIPLEGILYVGNRSKYFITLGCFVEFLMDTESDPIPDLGNLGGSDFYTYEQGRDREIGYGFRASGGFFQDFSFGQVHLEGFFSYSVSNFINPGDLTTETPDISNLWVVGGAIGYLIPFKSRK